MRETCSHLPHFLILFSRRQKISINLKMKCFICLKKSFITSNSGLGNFPLSLQLACMCWRKWGHGKKFGADGSPRAAQLLGAKSCPHPNDCHNYTRIKIAQSCAVTRACGKVRRKTLRSREKKSGRRSWECWRRRGGSGSTFHSHAVCGERR